MAGQIQLTGYSDEPFQVYNNTFVRDGYEFICWNTEKNGAGKNINPNLMLDVQKDTTLYAKWKLLYRYIYLIRSGNLEILNNTTKFGSTSNDDAFEYTPVNVDWTTSNSFEFVFKILTPTSNLDKKQVIFGMQNNSLFNLVIQNNNIKFELTGTSSNVNLESGKWYYIKFNKNATTYKVEYSTNGSSYNTLLTATSTSTLTNAPLFIGRKYTRLYMTNYSYQVTVADWDWVATTPKYKTVTNTGTRATTTVEDEEYEETETYWEAKPGCCWYSTNGIDPCVDPEYAVVPKSSHLSKNRSQCGSFKKRKVKKTRKVEVPSTETYTYTSEVQDGYNYEYLQVGSHEETLQSTRTDYDYGYTFEGKIDFNNSYIVLNNVKHKLKA